METPDNQFPTTLPPAPAPASPNQEQLAIIQRKLFLDTRIRNAVDWFFWIAGLSLINSGAYFLNLDWSFFAGLGITQIVDGVMTAIANEVGNYGFIPRIIGLMVNVGIAGLFAGAGLLGRKRNRAVIIIGMVLYGLDGLLLLAFGGYFSALFHGYAIFSI